MPYQSKAVKAAILVRNIKVERLNAFYLYHKEIIDEFFRLQKEVNEADVIKIKATLNTLYENFPPKNFKPKK